MVERFFAAAEDFDTVALLTAGKPPRRAVRLGEGARPLTAALQQAAQPPQAPKP